MSLAVLHPSTRLSDHLHLFFIHLCHQNIHDLIKSPCRLLLCRTVTVRGTRWMSASYSQEVGGLPFPLLANVAAALIPCHSASKTSPRTPGLICPPVMSSLFSWVVLLAETCNLFPSLGTAICHSVLYPSRGAEQLSGLQQKIGKQRALSG